MQKLDLRQNLKEIIRKVKSEEFLDFFNNTNLKKGDEYSKTLSHILIESKSGFEEAIKDEKQKKILQQFEAEKYYVLPFYSEALKIAFTNNYDLTKSYYSASRQIIDYHKFHDRLVTSYQLIDNLLFQDVDLKESVSFDNYEVAENMGYISFEIMADNEINFENFSAVISSLNVLIDTVKDLISQLDKIEFEYKPKLVLADSGSNTVVSVKLPKEISKVISKIFSDVWLYLTDRQGYNLQKLNGNLGESLDIISKLKKAEENNLISPEQAEIWRRKIIGSTEIIIMNQTLTKSKSEEIKLIPNTKMLNGASVKYLTEGENIPNNNVV